MDQIQGQLDPEVAGEVIAALNRKVTNLRRENAELRARLDECPVKLEDEAHDASNDSTTQHLLEEIENYKSELKRRPDPEEVTWLESTLKYETQQSQDLQQQVNQLNVKLRELESERQGAAAIQEALEKEMEMLCHVLSEESRIMEKAGPWLNSLANVFDFRKFLAGQLVNLPPRHQPTLMTGEEKRRLKHVIQQRGEKFFSPHGIIWAGENGGCVVPLPSVLYNGKTQATEKPRYKPFVNHTYQFCGLDEQGQHPTYHGNYRCIAVVTTYWKHLASIDQKLAEQFLNRVAIETGSAPKGFISSIQRLYRAGVLKVECVALVYEYFDSAVVERVKSKKGPPAAVIVSPHIGGKRQYQGLAGGSVKKPKLKN